MPKIPGSFLRDGYHDAEVSGIEYRNANRSDNPMLVVELTTEEGKLLNYYCVVTVDGKQIRQLLAACGRVDLADQVYHKKIPSFELDELIGTNVRVFAANGLLTYIGPVNPSNRATQTLL